MALEKATGILKIVVAVLMFFTAGCKNNSVLQFTPISVLHDTTINGFEFVQVSKGPLRYGAYDTVVNLPYDYFIMKYEVTCGQYFLFLDSLIKLNRAFVSEGKIYTKVTQIPSFPDSVVYIKVLDPAINFADGRLKLNPYYSTHPVTQVNWFGCMAFCQFYGLDLPTRYEWEKAAHGNTAYMFPWGNYIDSTYANYYGANHPYKGGTTPVGYFNGSKHNGFNTHNNASPYGCYDMAGNAYEYTVEFLCAPVGGGGGYHYHTAGMVSVHFQNCFGLPLPNDIQRCDTADGFRAVYRPTL